MSFASNYDSVFIILLQTGFKPGHRRSPSDLDFLEKTRRDCKAAMNVELGKLTNTFPGDKAVRLCFNPYLMNGFAHRYQLGESTLIFRGVRSDFEFLSHFLMKLLLANRIAPDDSAASIWGYAVCLCPIKRSPG